MIVLDTNVLSEPLRVRPDPRVLDWLKSCGSSTITAVTVGEVLRGVARLPDGQRKTSLAAAIDRAIGGTEVLPYDESAARIHAEIDAERCSIGRPMSIEDGMIAAICLARGMALATRNGKDFEMLGLEVVDPWSAA